MKNLIIIAIFCMVFASTVAIAGNDNETRHITEGLVYGEGHAFWISAPNGWILDNKSGVAQGLHAVFYPASSTWKDSSVVMYVNTASREKYNSMEELIDEDIKQYKEKGSKDIKVEKADDIKTQDRKTAKVLIFTGDQWGNYDAVAFIGENKIFVMIALTSRDEANFQKSLKSFKALVESYKFMTEKVVIEKK